MQYSNAAVVDFQFDEFLNPVFIISNFQTDLSPGLRVSDTVTVKWINLCVGIKIVAIFGHSE